MIGDALTDAQKRSLLVLVHDGLSEIRHLCWQGQAQQAADLADAIENIPTEIVGIGVFEWSQLRRLLSKYEAKYPKRVYNYVEQIDKIKLLL